MKVKNIPTWFLEQAVFVACLSLAVYGQVREASGPEASHRIIGAVVAALAAFAAQKVRSGADRQREQDELHGVERARLACAKRIAMWAEGAQLASVLLVATTVITSHSAWSTPAMAFAAFYSAWRKFYRSRVPVKSDDGDMRPIDKRAEDLGNAVASAVLLGKEMREGESTLDAMIRLHQDATKWRMPATERLVEILQTEQRDGENPLDTAERLVGEAKAYQAYAQQSDEPECDDSETTVFTRPQPAPVNASGTALWPMIVEELEREARACDKPVYALVAADARARHEFGMAKYGVPLVSDNGRDHLADAYQEALDCVVYMRAARESSGEVDGPLSDLYRTLLEDAVDVRGALFARDGK